MAVHGLYAGNLGVPDVFSAVEGGKPDARQRALRSFYAHLYVALWYDSQDNIEKTRFHLEQSLEGAEVGHYMETVARVHLARLTEPVP